jgi:predicted dehydrogenase
MVLYNDLDANEPIRIYDSGYQARTDEDRNRLLFDYRAGNVFAPKISGKEALAALASDFLDAIKTGRPPTSDGRFGADVVAILECAEKSVRLRGAEVSIL